MKHGGFRMVMVDDEVSVLPLVKKKEGTSIQDVPSLLLIAYSFFD